MKLFFKFKIALISFAVSGALLTTFGITFFAFIYSSGIERMDRELRSLVEVPMSSEHASGYWTQFGNSVKFMQGEGSADRLALFIRDSSGKILFQSENAPAQFRQLPLPDAPEAEQPERNEIHSEQFITRNDKNQDGNVTAEELDGPAHLFSSLDENKDGLIDADEAGNFRPPRQGGRAQQRPGSGGPPPMGNDRRGPGGGPSAPKTPGPTVSSFTSLELPSGSWRVGLFRNPNFTIIAAINMDAFYAEVNQFRYAFMTAVPLGLLILGLLGWYLADRAMKPVSIIADTAASISAKGLDKRIPMVGNDIELERLVTVSNDMLDRLEKSYNQAVRFSADAAHELQTPLTILQGELDNAIQTSEDGSEEQQRYSMLLEELRNLKAVVQKLLLLSHADEGRLNINPQLVDQSELVENAGEDIEIMDPELQIEMRVEKPVTLQADQALLNQTIRNMTSNAAKYSTESGRAVFTLEQSNQVIRFTIANTAPPIPDEDQPLLFERFHRVEKSRTASGSGLGLSLAREIARAHGGELELNPYKDGMVSFTLSLPQT